MKKLLIFSLFIFGLLINSYAANKSGTIPTGQTMLSRPFTFAASDTVVTGTTTTYLISNLQKYSQNQVFTIGLTVVTGTHNMAITAYGKVAYGGSLAGGTWVQIGTPITWVTASNNGAITSTSPLNYNYFKVTFVENGSACKALVSQFEIKTSNAFDIPASSGTLTISRATSGAVVIQTKDDNSNADATYRAGGTGALTLGSTDGPTTITSNGTIASTNNLTNFVAYSTDVDGRSIYGKATVSSGFNTTGPVIGAGVFGRVNGSSPTLTAKTAYIGGTFGYYGITGNISTNYHPKGGLIGVIGDGTTSADGAVVALLDGDTGTTTATAAYAVRQTNSTGASGFSYGLDLYGAAIGTYLAVAYKTAQIRLSTGVLVISGAATTRQGILDSGEDAPVGSMYISTGTGGHVYVKVAHTNATSDWNVITTTAAD